ncbi:hypothetical protein ACIRUY_17170 [Streptomyces erythrochromogenes]|uniref:hypothetical protein n=1 Tax=Streptomyces erythrochromogenes TaxID=285574 RepID=UPI00382DD98B
MSSSPDREIADLMDRSKAGPRNGTHVLRGLRDLPDVLADLTTQARTSPDGPSSDGWMRDDEEFCMDLADLTALAAAQHSG